MKRFEIQFTGCLTCGGDHYSVIDTMEEFKPELGNVSKTVAENHAGFLNEQWEKIKGREAAG